MPKFLRNEFKRDASFQVEVDGEPGRKLDQDIIDEIVKDAKSCQNGCYQILMLGGNNIRENETVQSFMSKCFELSKRFLNLHSNCNLIICGMIPSKKKSSKAKFKHVDKELRSLADGFLNVTFLKLANDFLTKEGKLKKSLYSDDIHLNDEGTKILADAIYNHVLSWENHGN